MHSLLVKVASLRVTGIPNSILVSVHWLLSSAKFLSNFEGKWLKASVWIQTQVFQMRWLMLCHRSNCISVENKSWQDVVSLESLGIKNCVFLEDSLKIFWTLQKSKTSKFWRRKKFRLKVSTNFSEQDSNPEPFLFLEKFATEEFWVPLARPGFENLLD